MITLFPERLRQLREASGKKQRELAKAIGVDIPMYSRYEHGERRPKRAQVIKLAKLLGADPDELVGRWLAYAALGEIGNDQLSNSAIAYLKEAMGLTEEPERTVVTAERLTPAPVPYEGVRNLVASTGNALTPYLQAGNALILTREIEDKMVDCVVSSLPNTFTLRDTLELTQELHRVLADNGSLWLHLGSNDIVSRVIVAMQDEQNWILAHKIAWDRDEGDGAHLSRNVQPLLHFVKNKQYCFNDDAFRLAFTETAGAGRSKGKTGGGYRKKIENSTVLSLNEKDAAMAALDDALSRQHRGEISDFRLYLRESNIPVSNDSERGVAINLNGFYLHVNQADKPSTLWQFAVERLKKSGREVLPKSVAKLAITATCPEGGLVFDPFCANAIVCRTAMEMRRRSIGFDADSALISEALKDFKPAAPKPKQTTLSLF